MTAAGFLMEHKVRVFSPAICLEMQIIVDEIEAVAAGGIPLPFNVKLYLESLKFVATVAHTHQGLILSVVEAMVDGDLAAPKGGS